MSSYAYFAGYYDDLTKNVEYQKQADYLEALCQRLGHAPGLVLDLACGTGSLTVELCKRGWDIYGVDGSPEMLSEAMQKAHREGLEILFLCQKMQKIDLYGTIDTVYKHREVLGNNTFVYDTQKVYCVWQNTFSPSQNKVTINLDFFQRNGNAYYRSQESFSERAYHQRELEAMLEKAGLITAEVFDELSFEPPKEDSQRLVFVVRKPD